MWNCERIFSVVLVKKEDVRNAHGYRIEEKHTHIYSILKSCGKISFQCKFLKELTLIDVLCYGDIT